LSVADSGCGIPAADLDRIFHRFARADPQRTHEGGGFGLGLAIVQAIAEAHHGSARASSTLGKGSVFEVMLPVVPSASSPAGPSPAASQAPAPPGPVAAEASLATTVPAPVADAAPGEAAGTPASETAAAPAQRS
jgi:two-component system OmpR family sensor kinase